MEVGDVMQQSYCTREVKNVRSTDCPNERQDGIEYKRDERGCTVQRVRNEVG